MPSPQKSRRLLLIKPAELLLFSTGADTRRPRLGSSTTKGLATDWRFAVAYNAVLQSATAALAIAG